MSVITSYSIHYTKLYESVEDPLRAAIDRLYHAEEARAVRTLLTEARLDPSTQDRVDHRAQDLVRAVRERKADQGLLDAFMQEYDLSSEEGVVLMCLAEALLRIPDDETAEKLIADKLGDADWESHLGKSSSVLVITSYSIHYTKLYDDERHPEGGNGAERPAELFGARCRPDRLVTAPQQFVGRGVVAFAAQPRHCEHACVEQRTEEAGEEHHLGKDEPHHAHAERGVDRITSYNVCYTKLLRSLNSGQVTGIISVVALSFIVQEPSEIIACASDRSYNFV